LTTSFYVSTINKKIQFDQNKEAINQEKHGISLQNATLIDWETVLVWTDNRRTTKSSASAR